MTLIGLLISLPVEWWAGVVAVVCNWRAVLDYMETER